MSTVIDIHPHVIAADTERYPLTPLGGHQSDWSRERPVSFEKMIADMDEAGIAKAALVQAAWTGDKDSMVASHVKHIEQAAKQGAQVICLQELFYGPYFCQVQDTKHYSYTEKIPDGPTTKLMQELARKHGMVIIAPMYEEDQVGIYYNTAAVIDADEANLIAATRLDTATVAQVADKLGIAPSTASAWRGKAERRLAAAIADGEISGVVLRARFTGNRDAEARRNGVVSLPPRPRAVGARHAR